MENPCEVRPTGEPSGSAGQGQVAVPSRATGFSVGRALRWVAGRAAFVAFGLVVALGLGEIALRIFGHEGPVYTIRDPVIGRRYTRSWEGDCYVEESERVVHLRFNREGMRDRD